MNAEFTKYAAELVTNYIEFFATILISLTIIIIILNNIYHLVSKDDRSFKVWRNRAWKGIQGGLDLFVAADLLSTITIERTMDSVITLGILFLIRTLISWSIEMETEGCWPWQKKSFELKEKPNNT